MATYKGENNPNFKHGMKGTRIYDTWLGMKARCNNPKSKDYKYYGGKGIAVCKEWRDDFIVFYNWAMSNGYKEGLTLDRINHDGNYEPANCQWITRSENAKKVFKDNPALREKIGALKRLEKELLRFDTYMYKDDLKVLKEFSEINEVPISKLTREAVSEYIENNEELRKIKEELEG